jgi:hypothetical protein
VDKKLSRGSFLRRKAMGGGSFEEQEEINFGEERFLSF